jgi:hypothetical protein
MWFTLKNGSFTTKVSFTDANDIFLIGAKYAAMRKVLFAVMLLCAVHSSAQGSGPDPIVSIANVTNASTRTGTSTISQILTANNLTISNTAGWKITSYSLGIKRSNGDLIGPFMAKGSELSQEIKESLNMARGSSGTIYIEEIKAIGPDRRTRTLGDVTINYTN